MQRILFTIGDFQIYSWDFLNLVGLVVTMIVAIASKPKDFPVSRFQIAISGIILFVFALLGCRLLHIILYFHNYRGVPFSKVLFQRGGFAYIGGPILGIFALWVYYKSRKLHFLEVADYAMPLLILYQSIGRVGCFLNGCCYGIATELPWGVVFINQDIARHPTQIYSSIILLLICLLVKVNYAQWRTSKGFTFFVTLLLYGGYRFCLEFLRIDSYRIISFITLAQLASLGILLLGAIGMFIVNKEGLRLSSMQVFLHRRFNSFIVSIYMALLFYMLIIGIRHIINTGV